MSSSGLATTPDPCRRAEAGHWSGSVLRWRLMHEMVAPAAGWAGQAGTAGSWHGCVHGPTAAAANQSTTPFSLLSLYLFCVRPSVPCRFMSLMLFLLLPRRLAAASANLTTPPSVTRRCLSVHSTSRLVEIAPLSCTVLNPSLALALIAFSSPNAAARTSAVLSFPTTSAPAAGELNLSSLPGTWQRTKATPPE